MKKPSTKYPDIVIAYLRVNGLEKKQQEARINFAEIVKIDDPRSDESFSLVFVYRKDDLVVSRGESILMGTA